ncbi:1-deoxy-D-xylulose-5-phosphate reductoisomerase [uncultured Ruminococcus sp.]|uniref:1-deoxy-D-xylulose-5-phosphate reductoisomerase n=1 Tax=uncultured Ruminococcus sp. TaxID=165186 RepID=UPI00262C9C7F|nr:1-deoxy-D-xylulose-5-phosphate reductoisomerase [uncultured Ruminococcus sp.]
MGKCISILGSTGSIGTQALEVAKAHDMRIHALAANRNIDLLERQTRELRPKKVCIYDETKYHELKERLSDLAVQVLCGMDGLCEIAADTAADMLLNSVVGMVGLLPTLTAISAGLDIALANKETLVAGGSLVMDQAAKKGVAIYPVDSEHSAIFQCLQGNRRDQLRKIILTASGGPFFGKTRAELEHVTVADALNHPNWSMGSKITVDSSTLMNKGLEFIEAKWLFDLTPEQIEVVVHRQSVVHSAVEYQDYSIIAQMGVPDMKIPIQYALLYPDRMPCPTRPLSLTDYGTLTFEKPDLETFTCLQTAITAITRGGTAPCVVNGANEEAVAAFLKGKIGFLEIGALAQRAMDTIPQTEITCYEDVMRADARAREFVRTSILQ